MKIVQFLKLSKVRIIAFSALALAAGTVAFALAYQAEMSFAPTGENRALQVNQVLFDKNDAAGKQNDMNRNDSEFLDKNKDAELNRRHNPMKQTGYLFDNDKNLSGGNNAVINGGNNAPGNQGGRPGTVIDPNGGGSNPDIIVPGRPGGSDNPGGDNPGGDNPGGDKPGNGGSDDPGGDNPGGGNPGGSSGGNGGQAGSRPADRVEDPDNGKSEPSFGSDGKYDEDRVSDEYKDITEDDFEHIYIEASFGSDSSLYKGQYIDDKKMFNALETFLFTKDWKVYEWGEDAYGNDGYIRITGVSFDGGETWINKYPVSIPNDIEFDMMKIRVEYRMKLSSSNWFERIVDYDPLDSRLLVLNTKLDDNAEQIKREWIISDLFNSYPNLGSTISLYGYQDDYLGGVGTELTELFPGWKENDSLVPWFYKVESAGRHVLEPSDKVPLDDAFKVKIASVWMNSDYEVGDSNLCYLQTLTGYNEGSALRQGIFRKSYSEINVPKYVQAIIPDSKITTDHLKIPDTVVHMNLSSGKLEVKERFDVDKNNPCFDSTEEDGILTDKTGSKYLNIPQNITELTVPVGVAEVDLNASSVTTIYIKKQCPVLKNASNCKIIVADELMEEFFRLNKNINSNGNTVVPESNEDESYELHDEKLLLTKDGETLVKIVANERHTISLCEHVKVIGNSAFGNGSEVTTIIMNDKVSEVTLEQGCFRGSSIKEIRCCSDKQRDYIISQLKKAGKTDIDVYGTLRSKEGHTYYESDGKFVLLNADENVHEFNGKLTTSEGQVTISRIDERAFAGRNNLKWVYLPESVTEIGYEAFSGCSSLQGVLIDTRDCIRIGDKSFDDCSALRFVASNAKEAEMENEYSPSIGDSAIRTFFCKPNGALGYPGTCSTPINSGSYEIIDIGDGCKALYGVDSSNNMYMAIRAGSNVGDNVKLPATTTKIYRGAFYNVKGASESFTVNWADLGHLDEIQESAFEGSDISGMLTLANGDIIIGASAFAKCSKITDVKFTNDKGRPNIHCGAFYGCDELKDIYFDSNEPADINLSSPGTAFYFNSYDDDDEISIHVPEGAEHDYIMAWRYLYGGYAEIQGDAPYIYLWKDVSCDLWSPEDDSEVVTEVTIRLTEFENKVRQHLGMNEVNEPTDFYPYKCDMDDYITLLGAPADCENVTIDHKILELSESWLVDYIGTGAFSRSTNLREVNILESLQGIYSDAFKGVESDSLTLNFEGSNPPELIDEDGKPFEFGVADSKLHINVSDGSEEDYIDAWKYAVAGADKNDIEDQVRAELTRTVKDEKTGEDITVEPTDEEIEAGVNKKLLASINRIRGWLGMESQSADDFDVTAPAQPAEGEVLPGEGEGEGEEQNPEDN